MAMGESISYCGRRRWRLIGRRLAYLFWLFLGFARIVLEL